MEQRVAFVAAAGGWLEPMFGRRTPNRRDQSDDGSFWLEPGGGGPLWWSIRAPAPAQFASGDAALLLEAAVLAVRREHPTLGWAQNPSCAAPAWGWATAACQHHHRHSAPPRVDCSPRQRSGVSLGSASRRRLPTSCGRWTSRGILRSADGRRCHPLAVARRSLAVCAGAASSVPTSDATAWLPALTAAFRRYGLPERHADGQRAAVGQGLAASPHPSSPPG